jgi:hypothetical protein
VTDGPHDNCDLFHIFSEGKLRRPAEDTGGRLIEAHGMNKIADAFDQISEGRGSSSEVGAWLLRRHAGGSADASHHHGQDTNIAEAPGFLTGLIIH